MKRGVAAGEFFRVAAAILALAQRIAQFLELASTGVGDGQAHHLRLDRDSDLGHFQRAGKARNLLLIGGFAVRDVGAAADLPWWQWIGARRVISGNSRWCASMNLSMTAPRQVVPGRAYMLTSRCAERRFFLLGRFYGPEPSLLDGSFELNDMEYAD